jgi:penicillin-binding protein 2
MGEANADLPEMRLMKRSSLLLLCAVVAMLCGGVGGQAWAATARNTTKPHVTRHRSVRHAHVVVSHRRYERHTAASRSRHTAHVEHVTRHEVSYRTVRRHGRLVRVRVREVAARHYVAERFTTSSFNPDITAGDVTAGEDPVVRAAAIAALGNYNGTALAIDPSNGRILAMVNQKLALSAGAEPCSTIKVSVALAALQEGLVTATTPVNLGGHYSLDMTHALARSVNLYFEVLGRAMGFDRVKHYANEFGLGELAGYNIPGEHLGVYPDTVLPAADGGVGRMCSFGESISMTPLQLGALVSAIANGGTLYYLQHPMTPEEIADFSPKVKRVLNISKSIQQILPGMAAVVNYSDGTARSLRTNFVQFPVFGKTGTCSDNGTRFGWFVSYGRSPTGPIVTVIFLKGDRQVSGPKAADLTGEFYRAMWEHNYFSPKPADLKVMAGTMQRTDGQ